MTIGMSRPWRRRAGRHPASRALAVIDPGLVLDVREQAVSEQEDRAEMLKRRLLRLALDVHDGPMQNLTAIGFSLFGLRSRVQALVPSEHRAEIDENLTDITTELVEVEQELRALISALEDDPSEAIPLVAAIEAEILAFERLSRAKVDFIVEGDPHARTDSQRIALQRVARAALANVARHAGADNVTIRLRGTSDSTVLEIEDDGRGFDAKRPPKPGHLGLAGMKERAELLGGTFSFSSRPGGPTVVSIVLKTWGPPPTVEPAPSGAAAAARRPRSAH